MGNRSRKELVNDTLQIEVVLVGLTIDLKNKTLRVRQVVYAVLHLPSFLVVFLSI